MKLRLRERARELGIPVLMDTSDRGLLDLERFDREPDRPILHGLVGGLSAAELFGSCHQGQGADRAQNPRRRHLSPRMADRCRRSTKALPAGHSSRRGLALGGALVTDAARPVSCSASSCAPGAITSTLEEIVRDGAGELEIPADPPAAGRGLPGGTARAPPFRHAPAAGRSRGPGRTLDGRHALLAPSGHNNQPWRFVFDSGVLECWHDRAGSPDARLRASGDPGWLSVRQRSRTSSSRPAPSDWRPKSPSSPLQTHLRSSVGSGLRHAPRGRRRSFAGFPDASPTGAASAEPPLIRWSQEILRATALEAGASLQLVSDPAVLDESERWLAHAIASST